MSQSCDSRNSHSWRLTNSKYVMDKCHYVCEISHHGSYNQSQNI